MASTASDVQAQAAVDAWLNSQAVKDMQSAITNAYDAGVNQAQSTYNTTVNDLTSAYNTNARAAYINKMQSARQLENNLKNLGLQNSGYGETQRLLGDTTYSSNLASLQNALATNTAQAATDYNEQINNLYTKLLDKQYTYDKYISDTSQDIYNKSIDSQLKEIYYNYLINNSSNKSSSSVSNYTNEVASLDTTSDDIQLENETTNNSEETTTKKSGNVITNTYNKIKDAITGYFSNKQIEKNLSKIDNSWTTNKTTLINKVNNVYGTSFSHATNLQSLIDQGYVDVTIDGSKTTYRVGKDGAKG